MAMKQTSSIASTQESLPRMCPRYEHAIHILGKRWTGLLLSALLSGPRRFGELTMLVEGLSDRVLSDRLRELESEGIIKRIVYPQIPVRVEYELTEKGNGLKPVVDAIQTWAEGWISLETASKACKTAEALQETDCNEA